MIVDIYRGRLLNHRKNNIASKLSGDIETNPGPFVVDPSRTIYAPYSQGNSLVFGSNAGKQCVTMSLIAILFYFIFSVRSSSDLKEIMNVGNELYTRLSQSAGQDLLMLTELPEVLCLRPGSDAVLHMSRIEFNELSSCEVRRLNQFETAKLNLDRLSRSSRLAQPGITAVDRL